MQAIKIEHANPGKLIYFALFTASLGYISVGYHLSILNSVSTFLWQRVPKEYDFNIFQNVCDATLALGTFLVALFLSLNKIKFADYRKILTLADILMIFGTICSLGIMSLDSSFIFFGRFVCAEAIGINITCILSYAKEAQFYLSQSEFKVETRRLFGEVFLAIGVLLGLLSSLIIPNNPIQNGNSSIETPVETLKTLISLSIVPVISSILRIVFLRCLGNARSNHYAQAFTDEGLCDDREDEADGNNLLYMIKFKETKSLARLFRPPYQKRLLLCLVLYLMQIAGGYSLFIVNPAYISHYIKDISKDVAFNADNIEYGAIFLSIYFSLGVIFLAKKVPRKIFMYLGIIMAAAASLAITIYVPRSKYLQILLFIYSASLYVGFGFVLEVYAEEVLPAKGLQFVDAIKWLMIGGFGLIWRHVLTIETRVSGMFGWMFTINTLALGIVCKFIPETAHLKYGQINDAFGIPESENVINARNNHRIVDFAERHKQGTFEISEVTNEEESSTR